MAIRPRMVATPWLHQINGGIIGDFSLLLSNNASSGGTCFGDSGGPNFVGSSNILAGVPSFGLNSTCVVADGLYRVDKADDLNWLATFPVTPCFSASMTRSPGESRGLRLSWPCRRSSRSRDSSQSSADLAGQLDTMS